MSAGTATVVDVLDHLQRRVVQEAVSTATAATWRRRAEMFRWAAPKPGDFQGQATVDQVEARRHRCLKLAALCDHRAALAEGSEQPIQLTCGLCGSPTSPWSRSCGATRVGDAS